LAIDTVAARYTILDELFVAGAPMSAIVEAIIIYSQTGNKLPALFGLLERSVPGVDIISFDTLSRPITGK